MSDEHIAKLAELIEAGGTNSIPGKEAKLLPDAGGPGIAHVATGRYDLHPISASRILNELVLTAQAEICRDTGVRLFPVVVLLKLVRLWFRPSVSLMLEYFGQIVFRDDSSEIPATLSLRTRQSNIDPDKPRKHAWEKITKMEDIDAIARGLSIAAKKLIH